MRAAIILYLLIVVLGACVRDDLVACDDGRLCPVGTVCAQLSNPTELVCATPEQLAQCVGVAPFGECIAGTSPGSCYDGVCLEAGCGNTRVDPTEACDDGNNFPGDGCAADCASNEMCGNGVTDPIENEQCDDGNPFSHDGCTGLCASESPAWIAQPGGWPQGRSDCAMVYDSARGRAVMFGGLESGVTSLALDDMWEWSGTTWARIQAAYAPSPRFGHAMAYDFDRDRIVLFGGSIVTQVDQIAFDETWEWDGTTWALIPVSGQPHARYGARMVYDPARKRVVLFGGTSPGGGGKMYDDTWEWDGTQWVNLDLLGPDARANHAMVYDPVRNVIVVAGGLDKSGAALSDTWELAGTTWTRRASLPEGRTNAAFAFDPETRETLLFGGVDEEVLDLDNTISWNGQRWSARGTLAPFSASAMVADVPRGTIVMFGGSSNGSSSQETYLLELGWTVIPPPPSMALVLESAAAFDPVRGRAIVFGGATFGGVGTSSTFEYDGEHWMPKGAVNPPPARYGHAMAFDLKRRLAVMFGGRDGNTYLPGTWSWDGIVWTQRGSGPTPRADHTMVYDAARDAIVLFGGRSMADAFLDDTWTWNGTAWTKLPPTNHPSPRNAHAMGYDPIRKRIVLFGGVDSKGTLSDLWEWDGVSWTQLAPSGLRPTGRSGAVLVWNPARRRLMLLDGQNTPATAISDGWEWDGTRWSLIPLISHPGSRTELLAFPAADGTGIVISGGAGLGAFGAYALGDTWRLQWSGVSASDLCRNAADSDRDSLEGCKDPDCWPACTPLCSPGTTCALDAPRCGDAVCDPLENCRLCPTDCQCPVQCGDFYCDPTETAANCPGDCL